MSMDRRGEEDLLTEICQSSGHTKPTANVRTIAMIRVPMRLPSFSTRIAGAPITFLRPQPTFLTARMAALAVGRRVVTKTRASMFTLNWLDNLLAPQEEARSHLQQT